MSNHVTVRIELEGGKVVLIQGNIVGRALAPASAQGQSPVQPQPRTSATERAQVRDAQARVQRRQEPRPQPNGHALVCPDHGRSARSRYNGGLYCPTELEDGSWCKWTWTAPKKATGG